MNRTLCLGPTAALLLAATTAGQRDNAWINNAAYPPTATVQAGPIALDPSSQQLVLPRNNGQTLAWDGTRLVVVGTTGMHLFGAATATSELPGFTGVFAFGGIGANGVVADQTLLWHGDAWIRLRPTLSPPARTRASMASLGDRPVLFGGLDESGTPLDDTWVFHPIGAQGKWLQVAYPVQPPARYGAAFCSDGEGGLLLFGGQDGNSLRNDTWRLGDSGWEPVPTSVSPPPGTGPMSFDSLRSEIIHVDPVSRATFRFDPRTDDWQQLAGPAMSVPFQAITSGGPCSMAFDPHHGEHVFVDFAAGVSVFSVADAEIVGRQPASCAPLLGLQLFGAPPRIGSLYVLEVNGALASAPVWFALGTGRLWTPIPVTPSGCQLFFVQWLQLEAITTTPTGSAWFAVLVPDDPALVGLVLDHQAADAAFGVTHDLAVRIGR
jgi:hypothetical protein